MTEQTAPAEESATEADETEEEEPLTADEVFSLRLRDALASFAARQAEILRLAAFMDERAAEIDSAAQRAKELIRVQIGDINEDAVHQLIDLFTELSESDLGDEDLSPEDRQSAIAEAFREITQSLPEDLVPTYMDGAMRAIETPPAVGMLRSSLLVSMVGELEMLVNFVARACFERQPTALEDSGREFSWAEITAHSSIDDFRDHVVDRAIEDVLRGSLTEWMDYFVRRFKIGPVVAAQSFEAKEAIQRRHCIVHNAGMVSSQYLDRLKEHKVKAQVGDDLEVTPEYLREAADTLYLVAYSLCWSLGFKLISENEAKEMMTGTLANRTYYLLQERRFGLVRSIGRSAPLDKIDELSSFVIRVNYWLAHKLDGKFDKVRSEVQSLDVKARSRQFNLAKHALLDEDAEAYRLAQSMIRDGDLRPEFLFTWPLLSGVRDYARKKSETEDVDHS